MSVHEIVPGHGWSPELTNVVCSCGSQFVCFADWQVHAGLADDGLTVERAADHLTQFLRSARPISARQSAAIRRVIDAAGVRL
jgi:hypothetical protein